MKEVDIHISAFAFRCIIKDSKPCSHEKFGIIKFHSEICANLFPVAIVRAIIKGRQVAMLTKITVDAEINSVLRQLNPFFLDRKSVV